MNLEREELHRILDEIPEGKLPVVRKYLKNVRDATDDPVRRAVENAPLDDEPETEEEIQAVEESKADIRTGRTLSNVELKRELGL
ncbi:MAG: hypothetical protein A2201_13455 [Alicyclobacillus sp. RIFOXYA1_FULL_53_8]|nr:MAG: hypothetical protein A2201_13455 [Alicyclobacillus sp. RIFOXYA1_FULL_53_8]